MTRIIAALDRIGAGYDTLFCDLWGCLHDGRAPYPAAVAALRGFRVRGGRVVLLTNAPRPNRHVTEQLDRLGVPQSAWDLVVSSGDAAQIAMVSGVVGRRVHHIGPAKDDSFFTDLPEGMAGAPLIERVALDQAEGIVCTGPVDEMTDTPGDYRATFLYAKARGLVLLCANPDLEVDLGGRRIWCAGGLAALYDAMGGTSLYYGKPYPPVYDLARRRLEATGAEAGRILAIGDGIDTDIRGGIGEGIDTLFVTGGLAAAAFGPDVAEPDPDLLEAWLKARQLSPTCCIGRLR